MKPESPVPGSPSPSFRRLVRVFAIVLVCLPMAGCNLLLDEFTWLDRVPVATDDSPAAATEQ